VESNVDDFVCFVSSFASEADEIVGQGQEDKSSSIGIRVDEASISRRRMRHLTGARSEGGGGADIAGGPASNHR
jgi:hypothetical protein